MHATICDYGSSEVLRDKASDIVAFLTWLYSTCGCMFEV